MRRQIAWKWQCTLALCLTLGLATGRAAAQGLDGDRAAPADSGARARVRPDLEKFRRSAEKAFEAPNAKKAFWGVLVVDADTGEALYEHNADNYFIPASNTKLFTTAMAMSLLGPDYRFRTTIETYAPLESDGRLRGDLILVGRGDPSLSNRKFPYQAKDGREGPPEKALAELADTVVAKGVKEVEGDVIADDSFFAPEGYPPGWGVNDLKYDYGAAVSAIAVDDNTIWVEVWPGARPGDPAWTTISPWAGFYEFENEITTGMAGSESKLQINWAPGTRHIALSGSIAAGAPSQKLRLAVQEPAEYAAQLLKRLLEARGVRIYGQARARHVPEQEAPARAPTVLAEHLSPPLVEIVRILNKVSQNLQAEMLLRTVAREKTGVGSREAGLDVESEFLKSAGVADGDFYFTDGSGLSRRNLVTPRAVVALLEYVARQPWGADFRSTLPVAGTDGTLEDEMQNTPAAGRIEAKTGSLEHARAISGFATTLRGAHLIFSMFGNHFTMKGREASAVLDAVCEAMVEEIGPARRRK